MSEKKVEKKRKYEMLRSPKDKVMFTPEEAKQFEKDEKAWVKEKNKSIQAKKVSQERKNLVLRMTRGRYSKEEDIPKDTEWAERMIK